MSVTVTVISLKGSNKKKIKHFLCLFDYKKTKKLALTSHKLFKQKSVVLLRG